MLAWLRAWRLQLHRRLLSILRHAHHSHLSYHKDPLAVPTDSSSSSVSLQPKRRTWSRWALNRVSTRSCFRSGRCLTTYRPSTMMSPHMEKGPTTAYYQCATSTPRLMAQTNAHCPSQKLLPRGVDFHLHYCWAAFFARRASQRYPIFSGEGGSSKSSEPRTVALLATRSHSDVFLKRCCSLSRYRPDLKFC